MRKNKRQALRAIERERFDRAMPSFSLDSFAAAGLSMPARTVRLARLMREAFWPGRVPR